MDSSTNGKGMEKGTSCSNDHRIKRLQQESAKEKRKRTAEKKGEESLTVFAVKKTTKNKEVISMYDVLILTATEQKPDWRT